MKKITKKLCSTVCALLAFSGSRGGALTKEALYTTKEILCNAGQWFACCGGYLECFDCFYITKKKNIDGKINKTIVPRDHGLGQKILGCSLVAATVGNAVDAAKRSYDIIKVSKNKFDAKKESTNYWPILEAIFGVFQLAFTTNHDLFLGTGCHFCGKSILQLLSGLASLADAYFRFRGNNQTNESPIQKKEEATQPNQTLSNPENSKDSSSDKK